MGPLDGGPLFGIGLYFTVGSGFFQLRRMGRFFAAPWAASSPASGRAKGDQPFPSGVHRFGRHRWAPGNIAGVATAITVRRAGGYLWMWVSALFGMMTKYARSGPGGPVPDHRPGRGTQRRAYVLYGKGIGDEAAGRRLCRPLCGCFFLGIGNMAQSNSIAESAYAAAGVPPILTGTAVAAVVGFVVVGGVKRIGKVAEAIIPSCQFCILGPVYTVLYCNWGRSRQLFPHFPQRFPPGGGHGWGLGYGVSQAVRLGVARGVFSNEAGLGSAPIAHGAADAKAPVSRGCGALWRCFGHHPLLHPHHLGDPHRRGREAVALRIG